MGFDNLLEHPLLHPRVNFAEEALPRGSFLITWGTSTKSSDSANLDMLAKLRRSVKFSPSLDDTLGSGQQFSTQAKHNLGQAHPSLSALTPTESPSPWFAKFLPHLSVSFNNHQHFYLTSSHWGTCQLFQVSPGTARTRKTSFFSLTVSFTSVHQISFPQPPPVCEKILLEVWAEDLTEASVKRSRFTRTTRLGLPGLSRSLPQMDTRHQAAIGSQLCPSLHSIVQDVRLQVRYEYKVYHQPLV